MATQVLSNRKFSPQGRLSQVKDVFLKANQTLSFGNVRSGQEVEICEGVVWLTQAGDPNDYVVTSGERFTITHPGPVVVQAMQHAPASILWVR